MKELKVLKLVPASKSDIGILIKDQDVDIRNIPNLMFRYIKKLSGFGVDMPAPRFTIIGLEHPVDPKKKQNKKDAMLHLDKVLQYCDTKGISTLLIPDATYFCHLTSRKKLEDSIGNTYDCTIEGYEHIKVLPSIHYNTIPINPSKEAVLEESIRVLANHLTGNHSTPGIDVLRDYKKAVTANELEILLQPYMLLPEITCDIETTGLKFYLAEVLTIAFGKDENSSIACAVHNTYHSILEEGAIKAVLVRFFTNYKGKLWFHNALYDAKVLTYRLFMKSLDDFIGMQKGLDAFSNVQDTMLVAYLSKNSTFLNLLGLKGLSKEFMGEYAENVKEAILVPLEDLLVYNAKDCCATWYVLNTYRPMMIEEQQLEIYEKIFQPSLKPLLKMMLTGLPLDLNIVQNARSDLQAKLDDAIGVVNNNYYVKRAVSVLQYNAAKKYNDTHKVKQVLADDLVIVFNPNSSDQLRLLLFDILGFEVLEKTKSGKGSTKRDFVEEYLEDAKRDGETDVVECLQALVDVSQISIILNTFINAFESFSVKHPSGYTFLKGNLKLGGTQSGRLSSSEPNLQNLPSGSKYGKIIKNCFVAPKGWLFCGSDFAALDFGGLVA